MATLAQIRSDIAATLPNPNFRSQGIQMTNAERETMLDNQSQITFDAQESQTTADTDETNFLARIETIKTTLGINQVDLDDLYRYFR